MRRDLSGANKIQFGHKNARLHTVAAAKFCSPTTSQLNELIGIWILWPAKICRRCRVVNDSAKPRTSPHSPQREKQRKKHLKPQCHKKLISQPLPAYIFRVFCCLLNISGSAGAKCLWGAQRYQTTRMQTGASRQVRYLRPGDNDGAEVAHSTQTPFSLVVSFLFSCFFFFEFETEVSWAAGGASRRSRIVSSRPSPSSSSSSSTWLSAVSQCL